MRRIQLPESLTACAALALLLLMPLPAAAQDVTEPALKAAFIYNFAKFTEWPADVMTTAAPLHLCVLGDPAIGDALERVVQGRTLAGHSIEVSQAESAGPPRAGCHILYVSGVTAEQAAKVVAGLRDAPVLTISDVERIHTNSAGSRSSFSSTASCASAFRSRLPGAPDFRSAPDCWRWPRAPMNTSISPARGLGRGHARGVDLRLGPVAVARSGPRGSDDAGRRAGLWRLRAAPAGHRGAGLGILHHRGGDRTVSATARWRRSCAPSAGCTSSTIATSASSGRAGSPCRGTTTAESCCWSTGTA